jgi:hypothetical protein
MLVSDSTIAAARERCATRPEWRRAVERAALLLPASQVEQLPAGRLRIVSARSGSAYVASPHGCTCEGAQHSRVCWHRAAARLLEAEAQVVRCRYCGARMVETHTPAGEPVLECSGCGHCAALAAVQPGAEVA